MLHVCLWLLLPSPAPASYLTAREIRLVQERMPVYEQAAGMAGVPVLALAAIHYLESDLRGARHDPGPWRCRNIGGPFMLDCGAEGQREEFDRRIRVYECKVAAYFCIDPAPRVRDTFAFAALVAGYELREKVKTGFWDRRGRVDEDVLAEAFWKYNGKAYGSWRNSPYVWNHPKKGRCLVMHIRTKWGTDNVICQRPGAMIVYWELERRIKE